MTCNPNECEARCCYDGVYLHKNEVKSLRAVVKDNAEFIGYMIARSKDYSTLCRGLEATAILLQQEVIVI